MNEFRLRLPSEEGKAELTYYWHSIRRFSMPLDPTDRQRLERTQGYAELGMFFEANDVLEEITPDVRNLPEVLVVRSAIYHGTARWSAMAAVTAKLLEFDPTEPGWFVAVTTREVEVIFGVVNTDLGDPALVFDGQAVNDGVVLKIAESR